MTAIASAEAEDGWITLQLEDSSDVPMSFEVDPSESLSAVFAKYAQCKGLSPDSLRFAFGDATISPDESPAGLGMGDGTSIRVSLTGRAATEEALARACVSGTISVVLDLLSKDPELCQQPLRWSDAEGQELATPPIYIAIDYAQTELVLRMLPMHKDIINKLKSDYSPLQWASWTGNLDIVRALVQEGGAAVDDEALSLAREHSHAEVAAFLRPRVDLYSGLDDASDVMDRACREGDVDKVRELLDGAASGLWEGREGGRAALSPAHVAARHGHMELVQLFAERGMGVDVEDGAPESSDGGQRTH